MKNKEVCSFFHKLDIVSFGLLVIKYFAPGQPGVSIGAWCNGSTEVFGTFDSGSNPDAPANA